MMDKDNKIWDILRKKWVDRTPEESVRQWFISFLIEKKGVPYYMMKSEAEITYGKEYLKKKFRCDILVSDRNGNTLMIVECKRPEVVIDEQVLKQALKYNMVLNAGYLVITNGKKTYVAKKETDCFEFMSEMPTFKEMLENINR